MKSSSANMVSRHHNHILSTLLLFYASIVPSEAFISPRHGSLQNLVSNDDFRCVPFDVIRSRHLLFMEENDNDDDEEVLVEDDTDESPAEVISNYKSKISARRIASKARPGSSAKTPI